MDNAPLDNSLDTSDKPSRSPFRKFMKWRSAHLEFCRLTLPLYMIAVAVIVASIIISATFVHTQDVALNAAYGPGNQQGVAAAGSTATGQTPSANQAVNVSAVNTTNEPYIGSPTAPVTIAFWSDYQCPFCKQFETTILPQIVSTYVDTGKVRIVFKDLQFLGPDSLTAAEIARAVWQAYPNKFYAWRQAIYQNEGQENHNVDPNGLKTYLNITKTIPGINISTITSLITKNKATYDAAIAADGAEAQKFGINGTPSFIVGNGNQLVVGGGSFQQFSQLITSSVGK